MSKIKMDITYLNNVIDSEPICNSYIFDDEIKTYSQMLKKLNINEYTVLIFDSQNNNPIPFDSIIESHRIKILKITFD